MNGTELDDWHLVSSTTVLVLWVVLCRMTTAAPRAREGIRVRIYEPSPFTVQFKQFKLAIASHQTSSRTAKLIIGVQL